MTSIKTTDSDSMSSATLFPHKTHITLQLSTEEPQMVLDLLDISETSALIIAPELNSKKCGELTLEWRPQLNL
jgi:hypothetical protein